MTRRIDRVHENRRDHIPIGLRDLTFEYDIVRTDAMRALHLEPAIIVFQGGPANGIRHTVDLAPDRVLGPGGSYFPGVKAREDGSPDWAGYFDERDRNLPFVYQWVSDE